VGEPRDKDSSAFQPTLIALDGPLLPRGADKLIRRPCESIFIHAPFHNRCKPGLSHWGWGLELRRASTETYAQFSRLIGSSVSEKKEEEIAVSRSDPIVEAFPNESLGLLTPEDELLSASRLKRGRRFDWLYERMITTRRLESEGYKPGSFDLPPI
jgi:hypothetical protein